MRQTSGINPLFSFPFLLLLVVSGFGKVSSTNEECTDALGRECFRYRDEDCVGVYETWARANYSLRCGYCPQKLPCVDIINYCSQFGTDVCQKEFYGQYLRENCRKTCNFCRAPTEYLVSSTTSTTTPGRSTLISKSDYIEYHRLYSVKYHQYNYTRYISTTEYPVSSKTSTTTP
ncbi:uncharacterized protein LOC134274687, partial [Saccostrea cucullata]|uniref:uncharacterized protein LOC134274687 n=1 Tax=Saccostrea cuccullata TaxID=36930 RepID=UPI002ED099E1